MKKLIALLLAVGLCLSCALADEEGDYVATNPYTIEALDAVIALPSNVSVTNVTQTDTLVQLILALDGRTDCSFMIAFAVDERLDGYDITTVPQDYIDTLVKYYQSNYHPFTGQDGKPSGTVIQVSDEPSVYDCIEFQGTGKEDGCLYTFYMNVLDGFLITVCGSLNAKEWDVDAYGTTFALYWQVIEMLGI